MAAVTAERAYLAELEGSCRTPIAGLAFIEAGRLRFKGEALRPDGSERFEIAAEGAPADAERLGREAGRDLKTSRPKGVLVQVQLVQRVRARRADFRHARNKAVGSRFHLKPRCARLDCILDSFG